MPHRPAPPTVLEQPLLEELLGAIIITRPDGRIVSWNAGAEKLFGFTAEEATGRSVFHTILPPEHEEEKRQWLRAASTEGSVVYEGLRRRKDGLLVYVDVVSKAITDSSGGPCVILNERDTTPIVYRRQAQLLRSRFGGVIEAAPDAIVLVDRGGRIALVNPETERLFGYSRDELLGRPVDLLIPERFRGAHAGHRGGYFGDPRTREMGSGLELAALRKDGTEFPVEISLSPVQFDSETLAFASVRDVTDRRRTDARFRALLEAAPDAMVIVDRTGRIALVNSQAERLFGYTKQALVDQPVEILVPERFRAVHPGHRTSYFSDPRTRPMGTGLDLWGRRRDGSEFAVEISLSPVETEEGTLVTAAIRDVSERRRTEKRRRETSERRLRLESAARRELQEYIDAMSTLNLKVSPDGAILLANRIAQEASGLTRESLLRARFDQGPWWSWDENVHERLAAAFAKALAGQPVTREENLLLFGKIVPATISLVPIAGPGDRVAYVVVEAREIERLLQAERALRAANEELEAFTYSVSHDLRAPLRQIDGFSRILRQHLDSAIDPQVGHLLGRIETSTRHMGQLVDDLLHLARVGRQDARARATQLDVVVRDAVSALQAELGDRPVEWHIGPLPTVSCDPGLVRVVFTNLLSNAVKYSRLTDAAVIEVGHLPSPGGAPVVFVRDNGVGFDMKHADKLFGVFQRLHGADQFEGTGVGLATVRRIVHKHGGEIWAEGKPGEGATFFFTLAPPRPAELGDTP